MQLQAMIDAARREIKQKIEAFGEGLDTERLTPELAERVLGGLKEALCAAGVSAFRTFLESYEETTPWLTVNGEVLYWKMASAKTYLTPAGHMTLERNLYQANEGGGVTCRWMPNGRWSENLPRRTCGKRYCLPWPM